MIIPIAAEKSCHIKNNNYNRINNSNKIFSKFTNIDLKTDKFNPLMSKSDSDCLEIGFLGTYHSLTFSHFDAYKQDFINTEFHSSSPFKYSSIKQEKTPAFCNLINNGNVLKVSFSGRFKDPVIPAIQMKVRGVLQYQTQFSGENSYIDKKSIDYLADSNWQDESPLDYKIVSSGKGEQILLFDSKYGQIGRVPDEISPYILQILKENKSDFQFQLSNIIAGNSKSASTIGLRVNLLYKGEDQKVKQQALKIFNSILNSNDNIVKDSIFIYQPPIKPSEILSRIFELEGETKGTKAVRNLQTAINTIANEIRNPKNKNILLLGHCLPDGDTIGCVLGMYSALKSNYPDKNIKCSIDDKIPGLYRDKLPGIEQIKRPYNKERIEEIKHNLEILRKRPKTPSIENQIKIYENEINLLENQETYFDSEITEGKDKLKFDLIILMDIPSPTRLGNKYKEYIENAKKLIFIDHHPSHYGEWQNAKDQTGLDFARIIKDNTQLILPSLPAATEIVTIVTDKAGLLDTTLKDEKYGKEFVAAIISGTASDTGYFMRNANLMPQDVKKTVKDRPNFSPEGLSKWLIAKLGNTINKKWLRENIVYDISDKKSPLEEISPREKMLRCAFLSQKIYPDNGLGIISIDYDDLYEIWKEARLYDEKITLTDIQNSIKYSEVMSALRDPSTKYPAKRSFSPYKTIYDDDKIAVLIIQDKKEGFITSDSSISDQNGLRLSFRSQPGSIYAELLASLFNGGGHGGAAGARIDLENINIHSKISFKIDGKLTYSFKQIYKALKENYYIKQNPNIDDEKKIKIMHKFEPIINSYNGFSIQKTINQITSCIRKDKNYYRQ